MVNIATVSAILRAGIGIQSSARDTLETPSSLDQSLQRGDQLSIEPWSIRRDTSCALETYTASPPTPSFPQFDQAKANLFRYRQQQSVNLGSWFVHEAWMTPSLFECAAGNRASELDIASGWNSTENARAVLEHHWDTFIAQSDFDDLAGLGINTVRLPIGYWSLGSPYCEDTPYASVADVYQNSWNWVGRAVEMAGRSGLGVLIDLHGAPGSQNGQGHSGISDGATSMFDNPAFVDKTIKVLENIATQFASVPHVVGIEVLNEPQDRPSLLDFYTKAIDAIRKTSSEAASLPIYVHDAFNSDEVGGFVSNRTDFVVMDRHSYFVFTPDDTKKTASQHIADLDSGISPSFRDISTFVHGNLVVDEWSCALSNASQDANSTGDQEQRTFCTRQMDIYANVSAGWSFWSYKVEGCGDNTAWCFQHSVGRSLPDNFFNYPFDPRLRSVNPLRPRATLENLSNTTTGAIVSPGRGTRFSSIFHQRRNDEENGGNNSYSTGFKTAKVFAAFNCSKLGFITQYCKDWCSQCDCEDFRRGLKDGEEQIEGSDCH